jgi:hypothetical protein
LIRVKSVLKKAAVLLQLLDCYDYLEGTGADEEPSPDTDRELSLLLKCFNLIYGEIACDYVPLKAIETVERADGRIEYGGLSKGVIDILSVRDGGGVKIDFKLNPTYIQGAEGLNEIAYTYMPEELGIEDEIAYETQKVSSLTFAYGTASEYCLIRSQFEEAETWEKRYKDALIIAQRLRKEVIVPKRGWY